MLFWRTMGLLALALGILGVALPVLPTTPFILLASWCFAKSSPKLHDWLLQNPRFGRMIRRWEQHRCISKRTKISAVACIFLFGGSSLYFFVPAGIATWVTLGLLAIGLFSVLRLPLCPYGCD